MLNDPNIKTEGQLIKLALGEQWKNLSSKTQARFEQDPLYTEPKEYDGVMTEVRCSPLGKLFAYCAKLINAPLIPYCQTNVPIDVKVYKENGDPSIHKSRVYYFTGRKPFQVHSYMALNRKNEFEEYVNSWLGMTMNVYAINGNLHFETTHYFIKIAEWRLPIPMIFSPGKAMIKHSDYGDDRFEVRIEMIHPWFGLMFLQEGIFKEKTL
ncbi:MAG: DUF4166 domain-containing protein [Alphaproteobacteria bacterium]|nr:DUF4166 domain-containing protein [Alphaproteobacteria bacterium]